MERTRPRLTTARRPGIGAPRGYRGAMEALSVFGGPQGPGVTSAPPRGETRRAAHWTSSDGGVASSNQSPVEPSHPEGCSWAQKADLVDRGLAHDHKRRFPHCEEEGPSRDEETRYRHDEELSHDEERTRALHDEETVDADDKRHPFDEVERLPHGDEVRRQPQSVDRRLRDQGEQRPRAEEWRGLLRAEEVSHDKKMIRDDVLSSDGDLALSALLGADLSTPRPARELLVPPLPAAVAEKSKTCVGTVPSGPPQPAVSPVPHAAHGCMRSPNVRVSERCSDISHDLVRCPPVYNDLAGEVDLASVQEMDEAGLLAEPTGDGAYQMLDLGQVFCDLAALAEPWRPQLYTDSMLQGAAPRSVLDDLRLPRTGLCLQLHLPLRGTPLLGETGEAVAAAAAAAAAAPSGVGRADSPPPQLRVQSYVSVDEYLRRLSAEEPDPLEVLLAGEAGEDGLRSARRSARAQSPTDVQVQPEPTDGELQERLQRLWEALGMSEWERMAMTIKYTSAESVGHLHQSLGLWEEAATLVTRREELLRSLARFERSASCPDRLLHKAGAPSQRLTEDKRRAAFYREAAGLEGKLRHLLGNIERKFGDQVQYKGWPYVERMRRDRVEMLYAIQQERRAGGTRASPRHTRPQRAPPEHKRAQQHALAPPPHVHQERAEAETCGSLGLSQDTPPQHADVQPQHAAT
uniref:Coiled-coil domain-containing protein 87 isoform X1 n=1 Tax=Petromyzon marinus TaxID=7757 RepID=A0AAJ7WRJ8_PETMA|nr:coiled-coil domain-containing protein 87 isoform X1 [Petromyzon marinus]